MIADKVPGALVPVAARGGRTCSGIKRPTAAPPALSGGKAPFLPARPLWLGFPGRAGKRDSRHRGEKNHQQPLTIEYFASFI